MKSFPPLRDSTVAMLGHNLESDEESSGQTARAAFNAEVNPLLGNLLVNLIVCRNWLVAYTELPEGQRPPVPWQDMDTMDGKDGKPDQEPLEFLQEETGYYLSVLERASRAAVLFGDVSYFEQVAYCLEEAKKTQSVENLKWLSAWTMARLNNKGEPPAAGDVAKWFSGPGPWQEKDAHDATNAFSRAALRLALAAGRRGKQK